MIDPLTYILDQPGFDFGSYAFEQVPDCGYDETITVSNLPDPPFVTHNTVGQLFTLTESSDLGVTGVYNIQIRSEFTQPLLSGGQDIITRQIDFTLTVSPCTVT